MSREILFRGKRTDCEAWVEGDLIQAFRGNRLSACSIMPYTPTAYCWKIDPETVGQFTGLTDKNGVRIFEGDIIRFEDDIGYVIYTEGYARFLVDSPNRYISMDYSSEFEVIGNIHDNPELLKKESETT